MWALNEAGIFHDSTDRKQHPTARGLTVPRTHSNKWTVGAKESVGHWSDDVPGGWSTSLPPEARLEDREVSQAQAYRA